MAIGAPTVTTFNSDTTAHSCTLPTLANGDLMILFYNYMVNNFNEIGAVAAPSGWTDMHEIIDPYVPFTRQGVKYRKSDGSDSGGTVDLASDEACFGIVHIFRIPAADWDGDTANIAWSTANTYSENTEPNPPSVSHTFGDGQTNIYLHSAGLFDNGFTVNSSPANYGVNGPYVTNTARGDQEVELISDFRQAATATSEDPGAYTLSSTPDGDWFSVAVKGPGAGGGGANVGAAAHNYRMRRAA